MGKKFNKLAVMITALLFSIAAPLPLLAKELASKSDNKNSDLIQALQQATYNRQDNSTDLDRLIWLSEMSDKIKRRIPNAFYRIRLLETVLEEASAQSLDPQLVLAVIDIESNFDRYAESRVGAQGLMQVMPFWKKEYGHPSDDLYNPKVNIQYGCKILRYYMDRYSKTVNALAAYNGSLGKKKYPNKIYKRLAKEWGFKEDIYSSKNQTDLISAN